ncbi:MAG TPA: YggT family protein [Candidatus Sulfotelmatobacter sp.]|nr:YggT family protein [Candidatus Sulfotelmatobacter sp.]
MLILKNVDKSVTFCHDDFMVDVNTTETKETTTVSNPDEMVKTTITTPPSIKVEHPQQVFNKKKTIFRAYQIIWYILGIIEILLGFRVALKALGANQLSGFTSLIYALSDPLTLPFRGILPNTISGISLFEWSTIIAAIVYALVAYGLIYIMQLVKPVTQKEVEQKVDDPS